MRTALTLCLILGPLGLWLASAGAAAAEPLCTYSRNADNVVLSYQEILPVGGPDPGPSLTVYGDGRALVHYPAYKKRAGDYELRLTPAELDALVDAVAGGGLLDLDEASARKKLKHAKQAATPHVTSDPTQIDIRVRVDRYAPRGRAARSNVDKHVTWIGLRADAKRHRSLPEIRTLADAHDRIEALMRRDDLERVR
jgi:hypothetical protein